MRYVSKRKELCLVLRPLDRVVDDQRRVKIIPRKAAEFIDGKYQTNDPEMIEFLHNHPRRNADFMEIHDSEMEAIEKDLAKMDSKLAVEPVPEPKTSPAEAIYTPDSTVAISPELVEVIDKRISDALGIILSTLQKEDEKESVQEKVEPVVAKKPPKKFSCPYCGEPFSSGFKVGEHKPVCEKRPSNI